MVLPLCRDKRERLAAVKKRLSELGTEFSKNLNEDVTQEAFTREQLAGMPDDFIEGLKPVCPILIIIIWKLKFHRYFPDLTVRAKASIKVSWRCFLHVLSTELHFFYFLLSIYE